MLELEDWALHALIQESLVMRMHSTLEVCESRDTKGLYRNTVRGRLRALPEFRILMKHRILPRLFFKHKNLSRISL